MDHLHIGTEPFAGLIGLGGPPAFEEGIRITTVVLSVPYTLQINENSVL